MFDEENGCHQGKLNESRRRLFRNNPNNLKQHDALFLAYSRLRLQLDLNGRSEDRKKINTLLYSLFAMSSLTLSNPVPNEIIVGFYHLNMGALSDLQLRLRI